VQEPALSGDRNSITKYVCSSFTIRGGRTKFFQEVRSRRSNTLRSRLAMSPPEQYITGC